MVVINMSYGGILLITAAILACVGIGCLMVSALVLGMKKKRIKEKLHQRYDYY